jgi:hypothetical protein
MKQAEQALVIGLFYFAWNSPGFHPRGKMVESANSAHFLQGLTFFCKKLICN